MSKEKKETEVKGFDLSKLQTIKNETVKFFLKDVSSDSRIGEDVYFNVYSLESEKIRSLEKKRVDRNLKTMNKKGRIKLNADTIENDSLEMLIASIESWGPGIVWEGKQLECTYDNKKMLLDKCTWIGPQLDEFLSDIEQFLGN